MKDKDIITYSADEVKKLREQSRTDWERVDQLTDEDIEQSIAEDPDVAPLLADEWFEKARLVLRYL